MCVYMHAPPNRVGDGRKGLGDQFPDASIPHIFPSYINCIPFSLMALSINPEGSNQITSESSPPPTSAPAATDLNPVGSDQGSTIEPDVRKRIPADFPTFSEFSLNYLSELQDASHTDEDSTYGEGSESYTTSLASTLLDYKYENGRRYHAYREGEYPLPNDEEEQSRLDLVHHIHLLALGGKLHTAPIPTNVGRVLDIGTGTGIFRRRTFSEI